MDEDLLRQLLASQDSDVGIAPTPEMMMMNSAMIDDMEAIDPAFLEAIQQQQQRQQAAAVRVHQTAVVSTQRDDDDDAYLEDETIGERIAALKEMFPESVQNAVGALNRAVINTSKLACSKGRTAAWWISSTMCVLVFPILIQKELLQVAEQISREQRSLLLGPQAATGAFAGGAF